MMGDGYIASHSTPKKVVSLDNKSLHWNLGWWEKGIYKWMTCDMYVDRIVGRGYVRVL